MNTEYGNMKALSIFDTRSSPHDQIVSHTISKLVQTLLKQGVNRQAIKKLLLDAVRNQTALHLDFSKESIAKTPADLDLDFTKR